MQMSQWMKELESHLFLNTTDQQMIHQEIALADLLDKKKAQSFLQAYGKQITAVNLHAPSTYFSSNLGIACSAYVTTLALNHYRLPITAKSLKIQLYWNEEQQADRMAIKLDSDQGVQGEHSAKWRRKQLEKLIEETVTPVIQSLANAADYRVRELWGQFTNGIEYGKKVALNLTKTDTEKERVLSDFHWLTRVASPSLFQSKKNALDFPYIEVESPTEPGVMRRMKPTCCLFYQTECGTNKCYNCPRLTPEDREKRKQELLAVKVK